MALVATTQWEVRVLGSANNGGGFNDRIPGTSVDYSQQNASQLSLADLACAAGSITVTSVIGGFTIAMVGNVMRIRAGNNFTVGFYEIVQFNSANSVDLDRVPVTAIGSNGVAGVGGAQINLDLIDTVVVPGNIVWVKAGTYAAHPAVNVTAVTTKTLIMRIIGYNAARGDNPTGNNRPIFQMGANTFTVRSFVTIKNVIFEGSGTSNITYTVNQTCLRVENCKITNTANVGTVNLISCSTATDFAINVIDCEFIGTAGATSSGISTAAIATIINSFFHNLTNGISALSGNNPCLYVLFNIFYNCAVGIKLNNNATDGIIINNTFANCNSGVESIVIVTDAFPVFMNNSFSDCAVAGINMPSGRFSAYNNNFFNCATPVIGADALRISDNNTFVNPQFFTPGSNFALQRTSGLIDKGLSMRLGV